VSRYVLLRVDNDEEADYFLRALVFHAGHDLMSPVEDRPVGIELVADLDPSDARTVSTSQFGAGERDDIRSAVRRSYERAHELAAEWETNP
jgi:hypothetical protein